MTDISSPALDVALADHRAWSNKHLDEAVKNAPGAECVTVRDGKITRSRFIFDRAPFEAARRAAT